MPFLTTYLEKKLLDLMWSKASFTPPTTTYIGLFAAAPSDAGGGTEVSGGSYARVAVTNNSTNWPAATGGSPSSKANGAAITFPTPSADWGTVICWGEFDASTSGNLLRWGYLLTPQVINNGDAAPSFAIGQLALTLD